jgi:hypothetical protein
MISQFKVGFSRTINLGNYESARVEAEVTYEIDEEAKPEDWIAAQETAQTTLRKLLEQTYKAQYKRGNGDKV